MSHHYTQASVANHYTISLLTILRDFGIKPYPQLRDNLYQVEVAIEEMKKKEIILICKIEKILDAKQRNKMIDAKFILTPHPFFASDIIKANERKRYVDATPVETPSLPKGSVDNSSQIGRKRPRQ